MSHDHGHKQVLRLEFDRDDFDLLDMALSLYPDLRSASFLVKQARERGVCYPIKSYDELLAHLSDEDTLLLPDHEVHADAIRTYMDAGWFPIRDELDLLCAAHTALVRCTQEEQTRKEQPGGMPQMTGDVRIEVHVRPDESTA